MLVDEGVEISEVVNELDYQVNDTTTTADILGTEITDYEVVDTELPTPKGVGVLQGHQ